jgi:hypothetical protein
VKFSQQYPQSQVSFSDDDCTPLWQPLGQHPPPTLFQPLCDRNLPHDARQEPETDLKSGLGPHWHSLSELQVCDHGQSPSQLPPHPSLSPQEAPEQFGLQQVPDLHVDPEEHVHVRFAPQPSATVPHLLPHVFGVQPHLFAVPPPPQVIGAVQVPQLTEPPHPSGRVPHSAPALEHDGFGHPHLPGSPPPPQEAGAWHPPHSISSEQPSDTWPHAPGKSAQVLIVHGCEPHKFGPPPPHAVPPTHLPHDSTPPHPSGTLPHCAPAFVHVSGKHGPDPSLPVSACTDASGEFDAVAPSLAPQERAAAAMQATDRIRSVAMDDRRRPSVSPTPPERSKNGPRTR